MKPMTQKLFAEKLIGTDPTHLSNILSGTRRTSWGLAKKLAHCTGTSPDIWMDQNLTAMRAALKTALKDKADG